MDKPLDAYLKDLGELIHYPSKDGDDTMAFIVMLDSIGPLSEKPNVRQQNVNLW